MNRQLTLCDNWRCLCNTVGVAANVAPFDIAPNIKLFNIVHMHLNSTCFIYVFNARNEFSKPAASKRSPIFSSFPANLYAHFWLAYFPEYSVQWELLNNLLNLTTGPAYLLPNDLVSLRSHIILVNLYAERFLHVVTNTLPALSLLLHIGLLLRNRICL